ncbi:MAG: proton-conducting transporter membrane subunit [Methyloceanibacter sp.]
MSITTQLFALFFVLCGSGAVAAFILPTRWNPISLAVFGTLTALVLLAAGGLLLLGDAEFHAELWPVLSLGVMTLAADRLSALFLFVAGLVFLPVAIFSGSYLVKYLCHYSLRYFNFLYFALFASIVLVLLAGDALSFLVSWEFVSIVSYLLVNFEYKREESSQAAFVMLAMSEAGTIAVAIAFLLVAVAAGSMEFGALRSAAPGLSATMAGAVFLLSFFGFAVKAGLVPVNSWLPLAHPVAPTNVSALLSAVIVNLGIYGIVRFNLDLVPATTSRPGLIVLVIGSVSALIGILYATVESEMKRLLAHSTIENMGIVAAGIGAAMIFLATGHQIVASIALIAATYHLANHSVYKALLFLGTGAVEAGAHTRDLDRLGGIARVMPWTSVFFLIGVMAIAALPPLNGFVSEWLTLQTVLRSVLLSSTPVKIVFAISGAMLALTAGLAVTCFVKVFAMGFLGLARSEGAANAAEVRIGMPLTHESATAALVPPFFSLAAQGQEAIPPKFLAEFHDLGAQVGEGLLPGRGLVVLHRGEEHNPVIFAMSTSYMFVALTGILALTFVVFRLATRGRTLARRAVWAGGLRRLWPGITYTATGFSNPVRVIFGAVLHPAAGEDSTEAVAQHFRTAITRDQVEAHIVDRLVLDPPVSGLRWLAAIVRRMHVGNVNAYAAYVLVALLLVLIIGAGIF